MSKSMRKILILILTFIIISCEEYVIVDDLPFVETLVVQGIIQHNKNVDSIKISRTLHPLRQYSEDSALIIDAEAILDAGGRIYRLIYDPKTKAYKFEGLKGIKGIEYKLTVKWKNYRTDARTFIPDTTIIDSVYKVIQKSDENNFNYTIKVYARFKPRNNCVYLGGFYDYTSLYRFYKSYPFSIYRSSDTAKDGKIQIPLLEWITNNLADTIRLKNNFHYYIDVYDQQFYEYYLSRHQGEPTEDIFGTSGRNIKGNVTGNGFGIFYGKNETIIKLK